MPAGGGSSSDPLFPCYERNYIMVPMEDGGMRRIDDNPNPHPWRDRFVLALRT
jgi:hypothetical protein